MNIEQIIEFARGGGMKAAPKKAAARPGAGSAVANVVGAIAGGGCGNGTHQGKRGFQPGNKCAGGKRDSAVAKASRAHQSARRAVSSHVSANTLHTPEGRTAVRAAASAHRELQAARDAQKAGRAGARKASSAVASGRASALPTKGATPTPTPTPKAAPSPKVKARVEKSLNEASKAKAERATQHLNDLQTGAAAGAFKPTDIHKHVERIGRGATKDELFHAAKAAGIAHTATTKKALVEQLKQHAHSLSKPVATLKPEGPGPKPVVTKTPATEKVEAPKPKAEPKAAAGGGATTKPESAPKAQPQSYTDPTKPTISDVNARHALHDTIADQEKAHHASYYAHLTQKQRDAINAYKVGSESKPEGGGYTSSFRAVNTALREGKSHPLAAPLDRAIAKASVPRDTVVYRGIEDLNHYGFKTHHDAVGSTIHDKAYVSTSLSHHTAHQFTGGDYAEPGANRAIIRTVLPKGHKASFLEGVNNMGENEYLLPRGSSFKITGHGGYTHEGVPILDAEVHHHHEPKVGFAEDKADESPPAKHDLDPAADRSDRFVWKPGDVTITRPEPKS